MIFSKAGASQITSDIGKLNFNDFYYLLLSHTLPHSLTDLPTQRLTLTKDHIVHMIRTVYIMSLIKLLPNMKYEFMFV